MPSSYQLTKVVVKAIELPLVTPTRSAPSHPTASLPNHTTELDYRHLMTQSRLRPFAKIMSTRF
jgi:hypothetical protein